MTFTNVIKKIFSFSCTLSKTKKIFLSTLLELVKRTLFYYYSLYLPSITASSKKYTNSNRQRNTFISLKKKNQSKYPRFAMNVLQILH